MPTHTHVLEANSAAAGTNVPTANSLATSSSSTPIYTAPANLTAMNPGAVLGTAIRRLITGPHVELDLETAFPGITSIAWLAVEADEPIIGTLLVDFPLGQGLAFYNGIVAE